MQILSPLPNSLCFSIHLKKKYIYVLQTKKWWCCKNKHLELKKYQIKQMHFTLFCFFVMFNYISMWFKKKKSELQRTWDGLSPQFITVSYFIWIRCVSWYFILFILFRLVFEHRINIFGAYFTHYHNVSEGSIEAKSMRILSKFFPSEHGQVSISFRGLWFWVWFFLRGLFSTLFRTELPRIWYAGWC